MSTRVRITDVSPRDGLQNEPGVIAAADKVRLVELLSSTGVDEVEVSSFVSAKWVPQLGDAAEVFAGLSSEPLPEGGARGGLRIAPRDPVTYQHAAELRKRMTGPEKHLWYRINAGKLDNLKVRRQHPFGPYILDFYIPAAGLCIEIDGDSHRNDASFQHDAARDAYLKSRGVRTLRVSNDAVLYRTGSVIQLIREACGLPVHNEPTPGPSLGEGSRKFPMFSALVPNERGMQGVLDVNARAGRKLITKVSVFTAASETFARKNTNASIAETIERFRPVVEIARREGLAIRGYVSCVIACPFEGAIAPDAVASVARMLIELGIDDLDLGDTIGAGTPETIAAMLTRAAVETRGRDGLLTTLHLHDTFGRAAECVKAALDLGVTSFDGSVAGLGGCPYASTPGKRAPGNISTETLVRTIHAAGYTTGVNLDALEAAAAFAREIVAKSRVSAASSPSKGGAA